jgi:SLT domain-containing protein
MMQSFSDSVSSLGFALHGDVGTGTREGESRERERTYAIAEERRYTWGICREFKRERERERAGRDVRRRRYREYKRDVRRRRYREYKREREREYEEDRVREFESSRVRVSGRVAATQTFHVNNTTSVENER